MTTLRARDVLLLWLALVAIGGGVVSRSWWLVTAGVAVLLVMVTLVRRESGRR